MKKYRDSKSKNGGAYFIFVIALCFINFQSAAQTSTTVKPADPTGATAVKTNVATNAQDKKTDPASENIDGTKKKSANQSIAQGLSISETLAAKTSPWGFSVSGSLSRGRDEYIDDVNSQASLDVNYRLNSQSSVGVSVGYSSLAYKKDGALFNNEDSDPGAYGFTDTDISYVLPTVWSDKYNRLMISSAVTLPTSRLSSRIGLNTGIRSTAILRYMPMSKLIISPAFGIYARSFRYDTTNAFGSTGTNGFSFNSPLGASYGISGSYVFKPWLIGSVSYGQVQRYDYNNDWQMIQSASGQVSVSTEGGLNIFAGYIWRDQVTSNEPLFAAITTSFFTGVGYAF